MANTGLLVLTNPVRVNNLLTAIKHYVLKTLYIQYFPEKNILVRGAYSTPTQLYTCPKYSQVMANIYTAATSVSNKLDVRILLSTFKSPNVSIINTKRPIELVIFDQIYSKNEADTFIQDCIANTSMGCQFVTFDEQKLEGNNFNHANPDSTHERRMEKIVVLGGTFDRLHNGHKILLSEAILHCSEKLVVGVTDTNMLKGKLLWELIEPCSKRISLLKDFLEDVDTRLKYDLVPINDIYGPTKTDPDIDLIVVSEETIRGAEKINQVRVENKLKKLDMHVVKLVKDDNHHHEHEESKISSSNHRMRLLGTRLKDPVPKDLPPKPYIIGLTGGIASGKSSVANKLENLGAGIVNCDKIAHDLYEPGKKCYNLIIEHFGKEMLCSNGYINRKALGDLVFNDKSQLEKLNKLVWPSILEAAKEQIASLYKKGYNFVVMEAAVLIQAGWQPYCHEIWTCIIPEEETIRRVIERNNISEEAAKLRIRAQPSNVKQVNEANVVVSTLWSYDVTQQQVQKAWNELMIYLETKNLR